MASSLVFDTSSQSEWQQVLPATTSVFGSYEYARIVEAQTGYKACLFVWTAEDMEIAYPFFLRPIHSLPFATSIPGAVWDTLTPEYTGPILTKGIPQDHDRYQLAFSAFCHQQGIVAEFAHLHPWRSEQGCLDMKDVSEDRAIVYVDLTVPSDLLWQDHFTYGCRTKIRRSQNAQVHVFAATSVDHVAEFHRIYTNTMLRNQAQAKYLFPLGYFEAIFRQMPDHACFMMAEYQGKLIAGNLYLHDATDVYGYLGGTDMDFKHVGPSNAVVYRAILWAQDMGKKRLILGGGYQPNDGVFQFKANFSPLRASFRVYRKTHSPNLYSHLCSAWSRYYNAELPQNAYFPAYRMLPEAVAQ